jgi:hypothetical protein
MMEWLRSFIPKVEWEERRLAHVRKLYGLAPYDRQDGLPESFVADEDVGGWYLMLAEAFVDHIAEYEPAQGSRIIPLFKVLGRDFDLLMTIEGVEERARRIVGQDRRQPDGVLFELLVALAYRRDAYSRVRFLSERSTGKTPDFQAESATHSWAIECKKLGRAQYSKDERDFFWRLWRPVMPVWEKNGLSVFLDLDFHRELATVPADYLVSLLNGLFKNGSVVAVDDEWCRGQVTWLDAARLRSFLESQVVLNPSQRLYQLLTGSYDPHGTYASVVDIEPYPGNPRFIDKFNRGCVAKWRSSSPAAVKAKARHFLRQLAEANSQLQGYGPGIVHIGFEAMEGPHIELVRHQRLLKMATGFDAAATDLQWLYIHHFVHESPPDEAWAVNETVEWFSKPPAGPAPRRDRRVVVPEPGEVAEPPWSLP